MTRPFILLAALLCATASWAADFSVASDSELRSAIQNDEANITVTADIDLGNSTLSIESGLTVTINLGGHVLDRKLTQRGANGGQVFTVRKDATLNLSNGTITGGWGGDSGGINNEGGTANLTNVIITGCTGDDRGGGICNRSGGTLTMTGGAIMNNISYDHTAPEGGGGLFNAEGATATLTNVTITGNEAKVKGGGGICNYGTLTIDGCTITGNSCQMNGGGIWTAATATLNMQGVTTVTGNTTANSVTNNLFLKTDAVITVTRSLVGSDIGIIMETPGIFTSGYADYHSGKDPATIFTSDETPFLMKPAGEEAGLAVHYIERSWDKDNHVVINNDRIVAGGSYTVLTNKNGDEDVYTLNEGVYVVNGSIHINNIKCTGAVKLVLCDGSTLTVKNGLKVNNYENGSVYIFSQSYGDAMGKLRVNVTSDNDEFGGAAIGGKTYGFGNQGIIEIHGGDIRAEGKDGDDAYEALFPDYYESGAGIGGGFNADGGIINIYGGKIEAIGYGSEPGIGSGSWHGFSSNAGGELTIYDGDITATSKENGPGIGGNSYDAVAGYINIHGGRIVARGTTYGAGIGGGDDHGSPDILITGGEIYAYGGEMAAGIGSGAESTINMGVKSNNITISGGHVEAYGGTDAAGIGGGDSGDCGPVTITGGYVYAKGKDYGAGIGGGEDGDGGNVTITGGIVHASAGSGADENNAIGAGIGRGENGSLTIGDGMSVRVVNGGRANKGHRAGYCRDYTDIYVELCDHDGASFANHHDGSHTVDDCSYCSLVTELHTYDDYNQCTRCAEEKILLADNADNSTVISDNLNEERSVVLSGRTLYKDGSWNTLCLPFDVALAGSPLENATLKTLSTSSFADGTLTLNFSGDVTSIEAGKPYIIKWDKEKNATYIIRSYTDWNAFATTVNGGSDYSGKTVLLGADIVVDGNTMVGTSEHPFKGTFDGNGHTLEIHYNTTEAGTAPFRYAKNANIRNLTVTGNITTSAKCASGLISHSQGTTSIDNCHSNVTITSTVEGEGTHGGFIASIDEGSTTLTNCLFDGKLLGGQTYGWGGLVGWKEVYLDKAYFNNCFLNPSEVSLYRDLNYTIIYSKSMPNTPLNHAYYKTDDFKHVQGTNAQNMSNAELLSALGDGWEISGGNVVPKKVYDSNITNPVFEGVTISSSTTPAVETDYVDFYGTYSPVGFGANDKTMLYMGANNTLYYPARNLDINAFRAYFLLKGIKIGDQPNEARTFNMNFSNNVSTGISTTESQSACQSKNFTNDTNFNSGWYSLDGRKLSGKPTQKGVYIMDGHKIVIK